MILSPTYKHALPVAQEGACYLCRPGSARWEREQEGLLARLKSKATLFAICCARGLLQKKN